MNKRIRKKKGLAKVTNEECWGLDLTLAKYILPRLIRFKEINQISYPNEFKNSGEWHRILDKMIFAFDIISNNKECYLENIKWYEMNIKKSEKIQEGLDLFAKYFRDLWD